MDTLRQEFALEKFLFSYQTPEHFVTSQWPLPRALFVAYRGFVVLFYFTWLVLSGVTSVGRQNYFIFLTNWSFLSLNASLCWQLGTAVWGYVIFRRRQADPSKFSTMSWFLKVDWLLFNVASTLSIIVSLSYWILLYAEVGSDLSGLVGGVDIVTHGLNSAYVLVDLFLSAKPLRLLHFYHSVLVVILYLSFSAIYTTQTGIAIYPILDWNEDTAEAGIFSVLGCLLGMPLAWACLYGLYQLRLFIYRSTGLQDATRITASQDALHQDQAV